MPSPDPAPSNLPAGHEWQDGVLALRDGFELHYGGHLDSVEIPSRLTGARGAPLVAALGGISAGRAVCALQPEAPGWWEEAVGPGRIHWAMVEYLPFAAYTVANGGVFKHTSENSVNAEKDRN